MNNLAIVVFKITKNSKKSCKNNIHSAQFEE